VFLVTFSYKSLSPLFKNSSNSKNKILKPFNSQTQINDFLTILSKKDINYDKIYESSSSGKIVLELNDGPFVIFSKDKDPDWQVSSLQLILARLTIESKKVTLIDLSHHKPIVKYSSL
jgi:hypothetical protein